MSHADREYFRRVGEELARLDVQTPPADLAAALAATERLIELAGTLRGSRAAEGDRAEERASHEALYSLARARRWID